MGNKQSIKKMGMAAWLAVLLALHGNAILRNEDPIQAVQTDAISYDQKMEQEKDGVKGPATPKVIYYGGQGFFSKPPSIAPKQDESEKSSAEKKKKTFSWSDWWEESPKPEEKPDIPAQQLLTTPPAEDTGFWSEAEPASSESGLAQGGTVLPAPEAAGDDWW